MKLGSIEVVQGQGRGQGEAQVVKGVDFSIIPSTANGFPIGRDIRDLEVVFELIIVCLKSRLLTQRF